MSSSQNRTDGTSLQKSAQPHELTGKMPQDIRSANSTDMFYIRRTPEEIIVQDVPDGATISIHHASARILVLGNVGSNARLLAVGGGARIDVMGQVLPGATLHAKGGGPCINVIGQVLPGASVFAEGGGAHVMIIGECLGSGTRIGALGGGARIEFFSPPTCNAVASGGSAEVLRF